MWLCCAMYVSKATLGTSVTVSVCSVQQNDQIPRYQPLPLHGHDVHHLSAEGGLRLQGQHRAAGEQKPASDKSRRLCFHFKTLWGRNSSPLLGANGDPPVISPHSWPRRSTTWRRAGPSGRPLTTSETSTSTKDSSRWLQPALRGTAFHCGAFRPARSLHRQAWPPLTRPHPHHLHLLHLLLNLSTQANAQRIVENIKSLYFYKASYFYCMLNSQLVDGLFCCKSLHFWFIMGSFIWLCIESTRPVLVC